MLNIYSLPECALKIANITEERIVISAHSTLKYARCNCCNKKSTSIHSSYIRKLSDLPASTYGVSINLVVRKFFCKNPKCLRKIFSEQPGAEVSAYSRMTNRAIKRLQDILIEVSAQKGAYIANKVNLKISSSTALRLVDQMPMPLSEKVNVLGIDDWAIRKGSTYGTILVDNETKRVIDILQGRDGNSLKEWLKNHSEIKVVTRDRASSFSKAVTDVLPNTVQIADRFHLYKNLSDCAYEVIRSEYRNLSNLLSEEVTSQECRADIPLFSLSAENKRVNNHFESRFNKVKKMKEDGYSLRNIAKLLKMSRNSVRRYASMDRYLGKNIPVKNNYTQYQHLIISKISNGASIKETFEFLKKLGFNGSLSSFYGFIKGHSSINIQDYKPIPINKYRMISPRKISIYIRFSDLTEINDSLERKTMIELLNKSKLLSQLRNQILGFKKLFIDKDLSLLNDWMQETYDIGKSQLRTFVRGLKIDLDAVKNAIISKWSNGQVEGQVNRLKSIKRQMYGRAGFELLRKKVVLSSAG